MGGARNKHGKTRNSCKILLWNPEEKRSVGRRTRRRWENNTKMDLREIGCILDSFGSGYVPVAVNCEHGNAL
jgi:hypothetical protein